MEPTKSFENLSSANLSHTPWVNPETKKSVMVMTYKLHNETGISIIYYGMSDIEGRGE
jgi:hypothetical protein